MNARNPKTVFFTPTRQAMLVAVVAAIYPVAGYSAAGRVEFATTGVTAVAADGSTRPLSKGATLEAGDLIKTMGGRAQIRFSDGGYVSLQPNTEFRIDEYSYDGKTDGSEKGFFSLVKGGLRAITGAIGHVNKKNYQVNTAVATIGIRGTEFLALLNETLEMTCGEGICVLFNDAGELVLYAGESGKAKSRGEAPESVPEKPTLPPEQNLPDPRFEIFSSSNDRDLNGNPCSITGCASPAMVLPNLLGGYFESGFMAAYTDSGHSGNSWGSSFNQVDGGEGYGATFNSSGHLTSLTDQLSSSATFVLGSNAVTISSGSDGVIAWGRWLGNVTDGGLGSANMFGANDGWHYVVGLPTPSLPSGTASYTMIGATIPSSLALGNGTFNGTLNVDFTGMGMVQTQFDLVFAQGAAHFNYSDTFGSISSGFPQGYSFSGSGSSSNGTLCVSGCNLTFKGFFAGTDAVRAGMVYEVSTSGNLINGAAAFTKSGSGTPIIP